MKVMNDVTLHGHYLTEDCREVVSKLEYFNLSTNGKISIANEYRDTLQGKITLPSDYNGIPITEVVDFKNLTRVSHIFFLRTNTSYTKIGNSAFSGCLALQYIDLPNNITTIDSYAFKEIASLTTVDMKTNIETIGAQAFASTSIELTALPPKLKLVDTGAFMSCKNLALTALPDQLEIIRTYAFFNCPKLAISTFPGENGKLRRIELSAFSNGTASESQITAVYFNASVEYIGKDAFLGYGKNGRVNTLGFAKLDSSYYLITDDSYHKAGYCVKDMGFDSPPYNMTWDWKGEI